MLDSNARKEWTLFLLRVVVGFGLASHGYAKLARGPERFAELLSALHLPFPAVAAWATAVLEFAGGIGVMAGWSLPLVALPLSAILLTAMVTVHWQYGFSSVRLTGITPAGATFGPIGVELDLLYLAALAVLAIGGPGRLALTGSRAGRSTEDGGPHGHP